MIEDVVLDGALEHRLRQRPLVVGETDEVGQRRQAVPFEEAVVDRLDDREEDEDGVQDQRGQQEQGDRRAPAGAAPAARGDSALVDRRHVDHRRYRTGRPGRPARSTFAGSLRLLGLRGGRDRRCDRLGRARAGVQGGDRVVDGPAKRRGGRLVEIELDEVGLGAGVQDRRQLRIGDRRLGPDGGRQDARVEGAPPVRRVLADEEVEEVDGLGRCVLADREAVAAAEPVVRVTGARRPRPGTGTSRGCRPCPSCRRSWP